jgi:hypothetical protein
LEFSNCALTAMIVFCALCRVKLQVFSVGRGGETVSNVLVLVVSVVVVVVLSDAAGQSGEKITGFSTIR